MKREKKQKKAVAAAAEPVQKKSGLPVKGIGLGALAAAMLLALFSTFRDSPLQAFQEKLFNALKMPFYDLELGTINMGYPPYFIYNFAVIVICVVVFMLAYSRRAGSRAGRGTAIGGFFFYAAAIAIYCALTIFFLGERHPYLQMALYAALLVMFSARFILADRRAGVALKPGVLERGEAAGLGLFFLAALALYLFDFSSWKYSFIGDEYAFYDMAVNILKGARAPLPFAGNGVYGDHPMLASIYPAALMKVFGDGLFGWKLGSLLIPPVTMAALYVFARLIFRKYAAAIAAAAFAVSAAMMGFGRIAHDVVHPVLPFVLTLLCLELAMRKKSSFWSFAAGIVMGLGCYTFFTARLTVIAAGLYWAFHPERKKYPLRMVATGLAAYAATILFIFITPDFIAKMTIHSAIGGSEVGNPAQRPLYMIINYIKGFFAFLFKNNMSHFVAGSITDWVTAIGAMAGIVWSACSIKSDWRARWLLSTYALLLVFIAGLVQYTYLPATRMSFMAPMVALFAGVGFTRLAALLPLPGKKPLRSLVTALRAVPVLIAASGLYYFFVYFPANFPFTPETYAVKYLQAKSGEKAPVVLVTQNFLRETKLDRLYAMPHDLTMMTAGEFGAALKDGSLKGKICVLSYDAMKEKKDLGLVVRRGHITRNFDGKGVLYEYDFRDEAYMAGVREMWLTGKTQLEINTDPINTVRPSSGEISEKSAAKWGAAPADVWTEDAEETSAPAAAGGVQLKKEILTKFGPVPGYKNLSASIIRDYKASAVKLPVSLSMPSDMYVTPDGSKMLICEGESKELLLFGADKSGYKLLFRADFYGRTKTFAGMFKQDSLDRDQRFMYGVINDDLGRIFALDAATGMVKEFDLTGRFVKDVVGRGFLAGARCLSLAPGGFKLGAAVPSQNMIVVFDIDGGVLYSRVTTHGRAAGQFSQPSYIGFDTAGNHYIMDCGNSRVQLFDADMNYKTYYPAGIVSTVYGPTIAPVEGGKKPYFISMQPAYKRLLMYPLNDTYMRMLDLKEGNGLKFVSPAVVRAVKGNTVFVFDPKAKEIARIEFPEDVINEPPKGPVRR